MGLKTYLINLALKGKLPKFVYRMAGRKIAQILDLKENDMSDVTEKKPWYKSKTILSDAVTILVVIYTAVQTQIAPNYGWSLPNIPEYVYAVLAGLGIYGRKTATTKV